MVPNARVVRTGMWAAHRLPAQFLHGAARFAGLCAWFAAPGRRTVAEENVRWLRPDLDVRQQQRLARRVMPNLLEAAVDLWRLPVLGRNGVTGLIRPEGLQHLDAALARGRGVILASGHVGPYELAGAWLATRGYPIHAMVESLSPETAEALAAYRTATGMQLIPRDTGTRDLLRVLRRGEVVALVCDRMVGAGAPGIRVPFGGGLREIPAGPASLASATGATIVPGCVTRAEQAGSARYTMRLDAPIEVGDRDAAEVTVAVGARLAEWTVSHADEWYVFQPAWLT